MRKINGRQSAVPAGSRVYAVGDIHGRLDLLARLHDLIAADAAASDARRRVVVYLGDYVDRGPDTRGVVDLLMRKPLAGFEHIHLLGNHEDYLLQFLENPAVGPHWCSFGGLETLASYGVRLPSPFLVRAAEYEIARQALAEQIPPAHVEFMRDLRLTHQEGDYFFAHAGVKPGVALAAQQAEDLLWIRDEFLDSDDDFGACVVHGHTIVEAPEERPNRIGIDTGAFATGRLTALVLDGTARRFIQT
ncbi:MAG: serine/threonine protein phosphatase [Alphaproteobacteria bacterium]|nr:serine/threonine protein phosphatase [Alphaproteobacteria bacterium]